MLQREFRWLTAEVSSASQSPGRVISFSGCFLCIQKTQIGTVLKRGQTSQWLHPPQAGRTKCFEGSLTLETWSCEGSFLLFQTFSGKSSTESFIFPHKWAAYVSWTNYWVFVPCVCVFSCDTHSRTFTAVWWGRLNQAPLRLMISKAASEKQHI